MVVGPAFSRASRGREAAGVNPGCAIADGGGAGAGAACGARGWHDCGGDVGGESSIAADMRPALPEP